MKTKRGWKRTKVFVNGAWRSRYERISEQFAAVVTDMGETSANGCRTTHAWICHLGVFKTASGAMHAIENQ